MDEQLFHLVEQLHESDQTSKGKKGKILDSLPFLSVCNRRWFPQLHNNNYVTC
uniref:Uncharacterized protein n=1 Tax=Manihot esculenta TaxID=3983 RepID=A0A2C9V660_MANES